jgi:hypothetical protein
MSFHGSNNGCARTRERERVYAGRIDADLTGYLHDARLGFKFRLNVKSSCVRYEN